MLKLSKISAIAAVALAPLLALCAAGNQTEPAKGSEKLKIAVFVRNMTDDKSIDSRLGGFAASISANLNALGFSTVDEALALKSLKEYSGGQNSARLNANIFDGGSAARIAEYAGANRVLSVAVVSLGRETRSFDGYGVKTKIEAFTLRTSSSLFGEDGAGETGINADASFEMRSGGALKMSESDILGRLLSSAAKTLADGISSKIENVSSSEADRKLYEINLKFAIEQLQFPMLKMVSYGKYELTTQTYPASLSTATVRIDGAAVTVSSGSGARKVALPKGIHTISADIPGFVKVEESIFVDGSNSPSEFVVSLTPDDSTAARWKNDMKFVQSIVDSAVKTDSKLIISEAEAEKLKGIAETFKKSNITIDLGFGNK